MLSCPAPTAGQHALGTTDAKAVTEEVGASPNSMCEAVRLLHSFDISMTWGPTQSCTRAERIRRLRKLGREPPAWVENILCMHPQLADVKPESYPWLSLNSCFKPGRPDASKSKTCSAAETDTNVRPIAAVPVNKSKGQRRREKHNKHSSKPNLTSRTERTLAEFWHLVLDVQLPTHLSARSPPVTY